MQWARFFEVVVEPAAPRYALILIAHDIRFDRREFLVAHTVSKYVLGGLDRLLSGHLSALHGEGLPQAAVDTRIQDRITGRAWAPFPRRYCDSPAAALTLAAKLALGSSSRVSARIGNCGSRNIVLDAKQDITPATISAFERALEVCESIGPPDFLGVSADFDRLMVRPRKSRLEAASIDLRRETFCVPATDPNGVAACEPLSGFAYRTHQYPVVSTWLSQARHETELLREGAIRQFLQTAEKLTSQLSAAIGDRPLIERRMEVVAGFVSRLQVGLGPSLVGLNAAAQITVFEWAASLGDGPGAKQTDAPETLQQLAEADRVEAFAHFVKRPAGTG